jgi:hypothetical protein
VLDSLTTMRTSLDKTLKPVSRDRAESAAS